MPSKVSALLAHSNLLHGGCVPWGQPVPASLPGVYLVSLENDPESLRGAIKKCPIDRKAIQELLQARSGLLLDGRRPSERELAERIASFWLPDEVVLYIGLAGTSLRSRVRQYYRTPLGAAKPHAGGWFLKVLANLDALHVHYAKCENPSIAEEAMLAAFQQSVSRSTRGSLHDPELALPFANLEWRRGTRKRHRIQGAKAPAMIEPLPAQGSARATRDSDTTRASMLSPRVEEITRGGRILGQQMRPTGRWEIHVLPQAP